MAETASGPFEHSPTTSMSALLRAATARARAPPARRRRPTCGSFVVMRTSAPARHRPTRSVLRRECRSSRRSRRRLRLKAKRIARAGTGARAGRACCRARRRRSARRAAPAAGRRRCPEPRRAAASPLPRRWTAIQPGRECGAMPWRMAFSTSGWRSRCGTWASSVSGSMCMSRVSAIAEPGLFDVEVLLEHARAPA